MKRPIPDTETFGSGTLDRLVDETEEWEVIGPLYRSLDGKNAGARVRRIGRPDVTAIRTWGAHERITVRRG